MDDDDDTDDVYNGDDESNDDNYRVGFANCTSNSNNRWSAVSNISKHFIPFKH
jgi:hypothetical protein